MSIAGLLKEGAKAPPTSFFRRREAMAKVLKERNTYSKMVEDEAVEVLNWYNKNTE